ncbi:calmodulin-lysine N-methyltransferase [Trifolium repens]|nr:calmodulin-lysine N-methyltransferase [Trifolium repens]
MDMNTKTKEKASSLSPSNSDDQSQTSIKRISRRTTHGFNLIPSHVIDDENGSTNCNGSSIKDARVCYTLPIPKAPQLFLRQRVDNQSDLNDFQICNRYNIDNTGLVWLWKFFLITLVDRSLMAWE